MIEYLYGAFCAFAIFAVIESDTLWLTNAHQEIKERLQYLSGVELDGIEGDDIWPR